MQWTHDQLSRVLLDAVRAQQFERIADGTGGARLRPMPVLDLALVAFPPGTHPLWANVLFSPAYPQGVAADIGSDAGAVRNVWFDSDATPAPVPPRQAVFRAPHPGGLAALMFAVGIARCVDQRRCAWDDHFAHDGRRSTVGARFDEMLSQGCAAATSALVDMLHRCDAITPTHNALEAAFDLYGLSTLRTEGTTRDGRWADVPGLCMTAWDTARLLWLADTDAPRPPWVPPGLGPPLRPASASRLRSALDDQALHLLLSSTALSGEPGWVAGLPARLPARWIDGEGAAHTEERHFAPDVRAASAAASLSFAHLVGSGEDLAADAGIVRGLGARSRTHYIVALLCSMGTQESPGGACVAPWKLAALGRTIDAALAPLFSSGQA